MGRLCGLDWQRVFREYVSTNTCPVILGNTASPQSNPGQTFYVARYLSSQKNIISIVCELKSTIHYLKGIHINTVKTHVMCAPM